MTKQKFSITGMHCVSCAMNIDGELEDAKGVKQSNTNFAKAITEVEFEENKITHIEIIEIISKVGYTAQPTDK